jgi:hypothetical protein
MRSPLSPLTAGDEMPGGKEDATNGPEPEVASEPGTPAADGDGEG